MRVWTRIDAGIPPNGVVVEIKDAKGVCGKAAWHSDHWEVTEGKPDFYNNTTWSPVVPDKIKFVSIANIDMDAANNVDSGNRSIGDIIRDLNAALKNNLPEIGGFENWGFWWHCEENKTMGLNDPWPPYHWIACYPVTGGSEAHYLHLDLIRSGDGPPHRHMLLVKVWGGWDEACAIANETARLLAA